MILLIVKKNLWKLKPCISINEENIIVSVIVNAKQENSNCIIPHLIVWHLDKKTTLWKVVGNTWLSKCKNEFCILQKMNKELQPLVDWMLYATVLTLSPIIMFIHYEFGPVNKWCNTAVCGDTSQTGKKLENTMQCNVIKMPNMACFQLLRCEDEVLYNWKLNVFKFQNVQWASVLRCHFNCDGHFIDWILYQLIEKNIKRIIENGKLQPYMYITVVQDVAYVQRSLKMWQDAGWRVEDMGGAVAAGWLLQGFKSRAGDLKGSFTGQISCHPITDCSLPQDQSERGREGDVECLL